MGIKILPLILLFFTIQLQAQKIFHKELILMGSSFGITVVENDTLRARQFIQTAINEIKRIEKIISSWDETSGTSAINRNAGIKPVKVSRELYNLIARSLVISRITDGAFDISYASMDKIWKFDGTMLSMPGDGEIKKSVEKVGYENIVLNDSNQTVFLKRRGMRIGFGAIGKGYAADMAKQLLISKGVKAGIINASGDMNTWGTKPGGEPWTVAIINPLNKNKAFATVPVSNRAVVTSGNYEKYVFFNGKRYSHIINPKTGYPATGIISVTVFAPQAEVADALATAVFVMGVESGLDRINQLPDIECIIINEKGEVFKSNNIQINTIKN